MWFWKQITEFVWQIAKDEQILRLSQWGPLMHARHSSSMLITHLQVININCCYICVVLLTWDILNETPQDCTMSSRRGMWLSVLPVLSWFFWSRWSAKCMRLRSNTSVTRRRRCSSSNTYFDGSNWSRGGSLHPRFLLGLENELFWCNDARVRAFPVGGGECCRCSLSHSYPTCILSESCLRILYKCGIFKLPLIFCHCAPYTGVSSIRFV